ncbi:MAG: MBL fold metallo-hydrolase [Flavobacteriales bacterium]
MGSLFSSVFGGFLGHRLFGLMTIFAFASALWGQDIIDLHNGLGTDSKKGVELVVLGIAQDGGTPQMGCNRPCCRNLFLRPKNEGLVSCLGLVDHDGGETAVMDATPDLPSQWHELAAYSGVEQPTWIFLTHAHIGHYSGLMQLGREALGAKSVSVGAMPRMKEFLENNGPWDQLVELNNIEIESLSPDVPHSIFQGRVKLTPMLVPHRDEYSETVGFLVEGPNRKALFIPDIDKWSLWNRSLADELAAVDIAFLDGTFFNDGELNRDMSEIPHPFVTETLELLKNLPASEKAKVHFIHLNHTNPLWQHDGPAHERVVRAGFRVAVEGQIVGL